MTERIEALRAYILSGAHHALRRADAPQPEVYRDSAKADYERTALRLCQALKAETPVILPGERILFTRTVPALPMIYSYEEWADITARHYIHEKGNVCNLSPDYGRLIAGGLEAEAELRKPVKTAPTLRACACPSKACWS